MKTMPSTIDYKIGTLSGQCQHMHLIPHLGFRGSWISVTLRPAQFQNSSKSQFQDRFQSYTGKPVSEKINKQTKHSWPEKPTKYLNLFLSPDSKIQFIHDDAPWMSVSLCQGLLHYSSDDSFHFYSYIHISYNLTYLFFLLSIQIVEDKVRIPANEARSTAKIVHRTKLPLVKCHHFSFCDT